DVANTGGGGSSQTEPRPNGGSERVQIESLRRDLQEASQRIEILKAEKSKIETEASSYRTLSTKTENDLKSLSDAYNKQSKVEKLSERLLELGEDVDALLEGIGAAEEEDGDEDDDGDDEDDK
ncbi:hypothetical protein Tco_0022287, partial [Tanacetum coccineum]